jgi:ribosomal protein S18 acetylase RimI-like enzyme
MTGDGSVGCQIRPATTDDAAFIRSLAPRFAAGGTPSWRDPERLAHFFDRSIGEIAEILAADAVNPREAILVAVDGNQNRLGFIHLRPELSGLTREWDGSINAVAVAAEAEGRGVGRALLAAGEKWAREQGFDHLALETFGDNVHARAFYRHLGFAEETLKLVKVV